MVLSHSSLQPPGGLQNPIIGKVQLKRLVLRLSGLQRRMIELHVQNHAQTSTFHLPGSELKQQKGAILLCMQAITTTRALLLAEVPIVGLL
jgi:hypothetical protein